jgi:hypothetical protein
VLYHPPYPAALRLLGWAANNWRDLELDTYRRFGPEGIWPLPARVALNWVEERLTVAWVGTDEDLESWLACDDAAITARAQETRRAQIVGAGGEIG